MNLPWGADRCGLGLGRRGLPGRRGPGIRGQGRPDHVAQGVEGEGGGDQRTKKSNVSILNHMTLFYSIWYLYVVHYIILCYSIEEEIDRPRTLKQMIMITIIIITMSNNDNNKNNVWFSGGSAGNSDDHNVQYCPSICMACNGFAVKLCIYIYI